MEYMTGKDLFDFLQLRDFTLKEQQVKRIILEIMMGVKYLHSYGIVHRDLKLENVMMSDASD